VRNGKGSRRLSLSSNQLKLKPIVALVGSGGPSCPEFWWLSQLKLQPIVALVGSGGPSWNLGVLY
jgi:hypothetical protein